MNTMLELAARALYARRTAEPWEAATARMARLGIDRPSNNQEAAINDARAALQAIRVPTDAIDDAGFDALTADQAAASSEGTCSVVFTAMIDAILNESANP